jgi:hypothetical protein
LTNKYQQFCKKGWIIPRNTRFLPKKACTLQRVCAIFIDRKPVVHGRTEIVGNAQPEALCGRDKFHSDRQEIKTGFVRSQSNKENWRCQS